MYRSNDCSVWIVFRARQERVKFKYFQLSDFNCQETGENEMDSSFIVDLDGLREACGFPFIITSGFRSKNHSLEAAKPNGPGQHSQGIAADIKATDGSKRMIIVQNAVRLGFTGIGVAKSFIHVDKRTTTPVLWCY